MTIKEKLEKLKSKISNLSPSSNRNYEFEADLEDHQIGNQNIYRLHYVNYHRIYEYYGRTDNNVGFIDCSFEPFMLPKGMSREDGFKVLSYLTDFIEKHQNLDSCSYQSVLALNSVLDLERLGFQKINVNDSDVIDLFTVTGRLLLFKKSKYYPKYFEWYTENVTFDEIKDIYAKCCINFYDLILSENLHDELKLIKKK